MSEIITDDLIQKLQSELVKGFHGLCKYEVPDSVYQDIASGIAAVFIPDIVEACAIAIENEKLGDEPDNDADRAYNMAIEHATDAVRKLKG